MFHLCTPFQDYVAHWRQLFGDITSSVLANALTCALTIAVQAVGLIAANKTPEGRKISRAILFFETRSVVPGHFLNWDLDSDRGIRLKRCALRKSAAVRDNRREQDLLRRRASEAANAWMSLS